jgi:hypothetical protein
MKRPILFRGYSEALNKWVEGDLVRSPSGQCRIYLPAFEGSSFNTWFPVNPDSVGQFTGLVDCNGVKIFEGDKLEWISCNPFSLGEVREVQVSYTQARFWCYGSIGIYLAELLVNEKVQITGNTFKPQ